MLFRSNSYEKPEPFKAGEPAKVPLVLQDVLHRFKKGHRLMVQVQSTWFPLIDRNPQKFIPSIYAAEARDFMPATQRVFCTPDLPSHLVLPVAGAIPKQ